MTVCSSTAMTVAHVTWIEPLNGNPFELKIVASDQPEIVGGWHLRCAGEKVWIRRAHEKGSVVMDRAMIERWGAEADEKRRSPLVAEPGGEKHHLLSRIVELATEARALDIVAEKARALDDALLTCQPNYSETVRRIERCKAELRAALGDRYLS